MPRKRVLTENIGCHISKSEYEVLKSEMQRRRLTVAEYLRAVAIRPLLTVTHDAEVVNGQE
jgi:hypothetical protein